jgi:glyoxylase-like metal-dependent hydrolase (beta-lactamase superfamily II)/8-oxo-dGTP pyrophosphatase MutT (NUDIX family)
LTRSNDEGIEIYLVERAPELRFFGGYWAFPGGVLDEVDRLHEGEDVAAALERCALRELFEETGILPEPLLGAVPAARRSALRERLLQRGRDAEPWREFVPAADEARSKLRRVTTITTPEYAATRHRTPFLQLDLPEGQEPCILPGELVRGRFWPVAELLERWRAGELRVVPPALFLLELLADGDLEAFFSRAATLGQAIEAGQLHRAYYTPGIMVAPLRTPTLLPATTTNCVLIGEERVYIVDPATPHVSEQERLFETLDRWRSDGRELCGVLLTHHHHDHVGAVSATAKRYELPVLAHAETFEQLAFEGLETREVHDGERLELGRAPDGRPGWGMRAHLTPGHSVGHLIFIEDRYRTAVVGDLISSLSTIVIDPPEGHMATYVATLRAMLEREFDVIVPAHGPAIREGRKAIEYHLRRRAEREQKLVAALAGGPATLGELLPVVYDDAPGEVLPYAERSLLAGLLKLVEEGRLVAEGATWRSP